MTVIKIAMIAVGGSLLALIIRQFQKEYSTFVLIGVCVFLFLFLTSQLKVVIEFMDQISSKIDVGKIYIRLLFKLIAIAYISQTASSICSDLGYRSVSFQVETIGKILILSMSLPVITSILETMEQIFSAGG